MRGNEEMRARNVLRVPQYACGSLAARAECSPRAAIRVRIVGCACGMFSACRNTRADRWLRVLNVPRVPQYAYGSLAARAECSPRAAVSISVGMLCPVGKIPFLVGKRPFLVGKRPFSVGKRTLTGGGATRPPLHKLCWDSWATYQRFSAWAFSSAAYEVTFCFVFLMFCFLPPGREPGTGVVPG